jgi:hypothetical protein
MRKLIFAGLTAFATTAAILAPAQAASLTVTSGGTVYSDSDGSDVYIRHHHNDRYRSDRYTDDDDLYPGGNYHRYHSRHHRCHTEIVTHWRHHHRVIEKVRVCG